MSFVPFTTVGPDLHPHPAAVDESETLAAVQPLVRPDPSALLLDRRPLSTLQQETVALAMLAFGRGRGFLLGDSTGLGKGRMCAATMVEGVLRGGPRARGLWVSTSAPLFQDARRDVEAVDTGGALRWYDGRAGNVRFATYGQLVSSANEVVAWLQAGGPDSYLVLDEVHAANNPKTKTAQTVSSIQRVCRQARVLYSTATSASKLEHLSFLQRIGLWGPGAPFDTFETFDTHLKRFACSATELLAIYMKQEGMYVSRSLSMRGVDIVLKKCPLTPAQRRLYDVCAERWEGTPTEHGADRQRFFLALITAFKMPAAIRDARAAVAAGMSVVIGVQGTGESNTRQRKLTSRARSGDALPSGPPSQLRGFMVRAGVPCADLALPLDPLDAVIEAFGADTVAELTGRTVRAVPVAGVWQWAGKPSIDKERGAFQRDERPVAVLSRAASTGISLHAHEEGSRPRRHLTVELPWSCERLVQQCGRSHRAGQTSLPQYAIMVTDAPAELRFVSTVAGRLQQLGALKHGDRRTASSQGGDDLLRMHTESGVTLECLRRAALALLCVSAIRQLRLTDPVPYGTIDYGLLRQNAGRAGQHGAAYTVRIAYRNLCALYREIGTRRSAELRTRLAELLATLVTAVPAVRFAVLREGLLSVDGERMPADWTPRTHRHFPYTFQRAIRCLMLGAASPETARTLGSLSHDVKRSIVERMGAVCPGPDGRVIDQLPMLVRELGRMTLDQFLNHVLCMPVDRQRAVIGAVAACRQPDDAAGGDGVMTVDRLVLPSNTARDPEFSVEVEPPVIDRAADELTVAILVTANPSTQQLAGWRSEGVLLLVHFMLNGQLAAVTRALDNPGYVDVWQPGRFHRTKRLTEEQWAYERQQTRFRFMDAGAKERAFGPDDQTADAAWTGQTKTYSSRLRSEARRMSRRCTFAYRNPLINLDDSSDPLVVRIDRSGVRFTGLLLRSQPYHPVAAVRKKRSRDGGEPPSTGAPSEE